MRINQLSNGKGNRLRGRSQRSLAEYKQCRRHLNRCVCFFVFSILYLFIFAKNAAPCLPNTCTSKKRMARACYELFFRRCGSPSSPLGRKYSFQGASVMLALSSTDPALKPKKIDPQHCLTQRRERRPHSVAFELLKSAQTSTAPRRVFLLISSERPLLEQRRSLSIDVGRIPGAEGLGQKRFTVVLPRTRECCTSLWNGESQGAAHLVSLI